MMKCAFIHTDRLATKSVAPDCGLISLEWECSDETICNVECAIYSSKGVYMFDDVTWVKVYYKSVPGFKQLTSQAASNEKWRKMFTAVLYLFVVLVLLLLVVFLALTFYIYYIHWKYSAIPQPKRPRSLWEYWELERDL